LEAATDVRLRQFLWMQSRCAYPFNDSDEGWALLAQYHERLPAALSGLQLVAFGVLLLRRAESFAAVRYNL
jgi:hypothetical protein